MIIELIGASQDAVAKHFRMAFFNISNNNLAVRKRCEEDLGMYDVDLPTSEDVDLCFRAALSPHWVAIREPGMIIRHKARRTFGAMIRQMWNWGFYLGQPYARTRIRGAYVYWIDSRRRGITRDWEWAGLPFLLCMFLTDFHLAHAAAALAGLLLLLSCLYPAGGVAVLALLFFWRYARDLRRFGLTRWQTVHLGVLHYLANVTFVTAAFLGGLRYRLILVQASILAPLGSAQR
jgi:hypothetical protein